MIPSTNVRSTITDEGVVLMDVLRGKIFYANPVGARVWVGIQRGLPVNAIVEEISLGFGVSHEQIETDVLEYLGSLKANGLILEG